MDTGTSHIPESWCMRLGENAVRSAIVVLVLTGQMLPAGSVSAQDGPAPPKAATPDQPPEPPSAEAIAPGAEAQPSVSPAEVPPSAPIAEGTHSFGDWTMIIRPGIVPARLAPSAPAPCPEAPTPPAGVSVPVTIHINNSTAPYPWMWSVPSTYPTWWNAPTSAYLFQRPRPYWQLRGDFHHLQPLIPGLWY